MTTFDGLIITFADGREINLSSQVIAWTVVAIGTSLAAIAVFFLIRWINRRDDPASQKLIADLVPIDRNAPATLRGSVQYHEDIVASLGEKWESDL